MGTITLNTDFDSLMRYASNALEGKKLLICLHNLNEALTLAKDEQEKAKVYSVFADLFWEAKNDNFARYCTFLANNALYTGGYSALDFGKFIPQRGILYVEDDDAGADLPVSQIIDYNIACNLIAERKYKEALMKILSLPPEKKCLQNIVEKLIDAVLLDDHFDFSRHMALLFPYIGTLAYYDTNVVTLFLRSGYEFRKVAVENVDIFIEDNENIVYLRCLGEDYFIEHEYEAAKKVFEKALSVCEIDELSLYYMQMISLYMGNKEDKKKYEDRYREVCKVAEPPMEILRLELNNVDAEHPHAYMELQENLMESYFKLIHNISEPEGEDIQENQIDLARDICCFLPTAGLSAVFHFVQEGKISKKPNICTAFKKALISPYVTTESKEVLANILIEKGYEGVVSIVTMEKAVTFELAQCHKRLYVWNKVYEETLKKILFSDLYIPIYCGVLANLLKKCSNTFKLYLGSEDCNFGELVLLQNYVDSLKINVHFRDLVRLTGVNPAEINELLKNYCMEDLLV